jgi:hypothetical protein
MGEKLGAAPGLCGCEECVEPEEVQGERQKEEQIQSQNESNDQEDTGLEFVATSIRQRGNRSKALLIRERREWLKQKRTNAFRRCDKVSSR